jgi:hypothetical protein
MEEIKRIAGNFAIEFIEEKKLFEKDPLMAIAVAGMFLDGFEYGYTFEGEKKDAKVGTAADKFVKEKDETIAKESPILYLLLMTAYAAGANKGLEERDKINIERDQDGNIIGLTNA